MTLFTLASSNKLPYFRDQQIHRGDGFSIGILAHVKRLDFFWPVVHKNRTFEMLLCQVTFVLRLEIAAPNRLKFEGVAR